MLGGGGCSGRHQRVGHRHSLLIRTTAWRRLVVHHLVQTAVLKQDVLPRRQLIHRIAEGIRDGEHGSAHSAVLHACVAVRRNPQAQVERAARAHREAQVGGHHGIGRGCRGLNLDCSAIEREEQRRGHHHLSALAEVQHAGLADAHRAAAAEAYGRGVVARRHAHRAHQHSATVHHILRARNVRVARGDVADQLLRAHRAGQRTAQRAHQQEHRRKRAHR